MPEAMGGPGSVERDLGAAIAAFRELVPDRERAVLAVSGGSDSLGLMLVAAAAASPGAAERVVGFVDHGLRDVAPEWTLVERLACGSGLRALRLAVPEEEARAAREAGSIQAWARDARYRLLSELAREKGARIVVTGHTRDDQAETFLLRLLRGAGLDGLGGIAPRRESRDGVAIVRPLLDVGRADIRRALAALGVAWAEDPSNGDPRYLRARVRHELLPLMERLQPRVAERVAAAAAELRGTSAYLARTVEAEGTLVRLRLADGVSVGARTFAAFPRALWGRVVRHALREVRGDLLRIDRTHYDLILKLLADRKSTSRIPLPGGAVAYVYRGALLAFPAALPPRPTGSGQPVAAGARLWRARFAALGAVAELKAEEQGPSSQKIAELELRARVPGDRVLGSSKKLKQLLADGGVPRPYRDFVPVLACGDEIVSCPGLLGSCLQGLAVRWVLDDGAPFLDVDFPGAGRRY